MAARAHGTDVDELLKLAALNDRATISSILKADGHKTGMRMKVEAALLKAAAPPAAPGCPPSAPSGPIVAYQVDFFGTKRGRGATEAPGGDAGGAAKAAAFEAWLGERGASWHAAVRTPRLRASRFEGLCSPSFSSSKSTRPTSALEVHLKVRTPISLLALASSACMASLASPR